MKRVLFAALPFRNGANSDQSFNSLMKLAWTAGARGYEYLGVPNLRTDVARQQIQQKFMEKTQSDDDTCVFVDCDHLHPSDIIYGLVQDDKDVVSGLSFRRGPPYFPTIFDRDKNGILKPIRRYEKGVIRVAATGFPAIAIKRKVFVELEKQGFTDFPNFCYTYPHHQTPSEDMFFCELLERAGIEIYCDTRLVSPHESMGVVDESSWEQYRSEHSLSGKKVSVVVHAETDHLDECIQSLINTAPVCEIILVAGMGTKNYAGVKRILARGKTREQAWDLGVKVSTGDCVLIAPDVVTFQEGWLENALSAFEVFDTGVGVVELNGGAFLLSKSLWSKQSLEDIVLKAKKDNQYAFAAAAMVQ